MFQDDQLRAEVYVDDPGVIIRGTRETAERKAAILLWWWLALGPRIAWKKALLKDSAKWIGASIDLSDPGHMTVEIPKSYGAEIQAEARKMLRQTTVDATALRRMAGKISWAAGICT
eukprot:9468577-Heterocapsa_arctica.AAC.1